MVLAMTTEPLTAKEIFVENSSAMSFPYIASILAHIFINSALF